MCVIEIAFISMFAILCYLRNIDVLVVILVDRECKGFITMGVSTAHFHSCDYDDSTCHSIKHCNMHIKGGVSKRIGFLL